MLNMNDFITMNVIKRTRSIFLDDVIEKHNELLNKIMGRSVLVIGGAGSIGSSFIKAILPFRPSELVVVDVNENALS